MDCCMKKRKGGLFLPDVLMVSAREPTVRAGYARFRGIGTTDVHHGR